MPIIKVELPNKSENSFQKNRTLYWYDAVHKKMYKAVGTEIKMAYTYDPSLPIPGYRLLPKEIITASSEVKINEKDVKKLHNWFRNFTYYNDSNSEIIVEQKNQYMIFEVPDIELDEFIEDLERNKFRYSII